MSAPWPPAATPPAPQPRARRTSLVAPVVLTSVGALCLLGALVAVVVVAVVLTRAMGSDVLTLRGEPGPAVVARADAPGATTAELTAGDRYDVHLVVPRRAVDDDEDPTLGDDVLLLSPSGDVVAADGSPGVRQRTAHGSWVAVSVAAFDAPETGTYQVAVPSAGIDGAWVALVPERAFGDFFVAIWGSVLGMFVVVGLGLAGLGATTGGAVWWVLRARARRATT